MNVYRYRKSSSTPWAGRFCSAAIAATTCALTAPAIANPSTDAAPPINTSPATTHDESQQQRLRDHLQQLQNGASSTADDPNSTTNEASSNAAFPSLGSTVLDAQLAGYISYIETVGVPDILIVGSSRALQGIDPEVLQTRLATQGHNGLKVYNFSVNGATAQVVNFILGELLPGPLPAVVVWGDGSRAFNDGRRDRTWESLTASPGYQFIAQGNRPTAPNLIETAVSAQNSVLVAALSARSISDGTPTGTLDGLGFSAIGDRFDPAAYYRQFPRVSGRYDGAYSPFTLEGRQTVALAQAAQTVRQQKSRLIFVNLPLSSSYLDEFRLYHEGQFQEFLQAQSVSQGFAVVDLLTQWDGQPGFFADPSHINQHGAAAIADQLARDPELLYALTTPSENSGENGTANSAPRDLPSEQVVPSLDSLLESRNP